MGKRKIKSTYDKVPCRSLCEKLPMDLFSDTEYVWIRDPLCKKRKGWGLAYRDFTEGSYGCEPEELVPAPTLDELLDKLPEQWILHIGDNPGKIYWAHLYSRSVFKAVQEGKNWLTMVCRCYLQYKKYYEKYRQYETEGSPKWKK